MKQAPGTEEKASVDSGANWDWENDGNGEDGDETIGAKCDKLGLAT
jgi:hypothetical protein